MEDAPQVRVRQSSPLAETGQQPQDRLRSSGCLPTPTAEKDPAQGIPANPRGFAVVFRRDAQSRSRYPSISRESYQLAARPSIANRDPRLVPSFASFRGAAGGASEGGNVGQRGQSL